MAEAVRSHEPVARRRGGKPLSPPDMADYPVREYVAAMANELAVMARWDGDEKLASALDAASDLARQEAPAS